MTGAVDLGLGNPLTQVRRFIAGMPYRVSTGSRSGYLAGEFPGGTTTVEGAPVSATVRILYRPESGAVGDGVVVAEVQSAPDGTWLVQNLNENLKYDVVGRKEGFNDVIVAGVTPTSMVVITYTGDIANNETFTGAIGYLELVGGIPPYAASVVDPLPAGLFPVVNGRQLIIDGTTTDDDVFNSTVRITSSNGATKDVPVKLVVGFKAPANFEAETLEDEGAFSVVLTWEVTNTTQEVLVFKSATPFDIESMPTPIATLTGNAVSYTDDDVIEDDVFYYMVASVCEGFTLYSNEVREVVVVGDPHWDKVVSLLHFDGDLVDAATGPWSLVSGDVAFQKGVFGTALQPVGSINLACSSDPALTDIRGSDFTIEFFIKPEGSGDQTILVNRPADGGGSSGFGTLVRLTSARAILFAHLGQPVNLVSSILPDGVFSYVAICWDSNSRRIYINGVLDVEDTNQTGWLEGQTGPLRIGRYQTPSVDSHFLRSPLDELRITKGVARYTENFTPPTKPFPNK